LKRLKDTISAAKPPNFPWPLKAPIFSVCCTTKTSKAAMLAGLCFGYGSALVTLSSTLTTTTISNISGCLAGFANCSGTYLGMVDNRIQTNAEDRFQDFRRDAFEILSALALRIIRNHCTEKKERQLKKDPDFRITSQCPICNNLIRNEEEIRASIRQYFAIRANDRLAIGEELFQAARYVIDGSRPSSEALINEIRTIDSPSTLEHLQALDKIESLEKEVSELKRLVLNLSSSSK